MVCVRWQLWSIQNKIELLLSSDGRVVYFQVYGIDKISTEVQRKILSIVKWLFLELAISDIICSANEIHILIAIEYAGYHPVREQSTDHLIALGKKLVVAFEVIISC